jgi:hypothetical protein
MGISSLRLLLDGHSLLKAVLRKVLAKWGSLGDVKEMNVDSDETSALDLSRQEKQRDTPVLALCDPRLEDIMTMEAPDNDDVSPAVWDEAAQPPAAQLPDLEYSDHERFWDSDGNALVISELDAMSFAHKCASDLMTVELQRQTIPTEHHQDHSQTPL